MYICIYVHWGISLPSKTPAPPLFYQIPHESENCQSPPPPFPSPLANLSLYKFSKIKFFSEPSNPHNIKIFHP